MQSLRSTLVGSWRYRGQEGQLSFLLHRISGLGTLLFLIIHVADTSTVYFFPELYDEAIAIYRSTPFMLQEIILVFFVIYHGINGLRVAFTDLYPQYWKSEVQVSAMRWVLAVSVVIWLPAAFIMGRSMVINNFLGG